MKYKGLLEGNCPFTGVCFDESFLDPVREFMKDPKNITFEDLINDCVMAWWKECEADYEHQQSEEYFTELCNINDYEFDEGGNLI
jgi:hypothetical protein